MLRRLVALALLLLLAQVVHCDVYKTWGEGWISPTKLSVDAHNNLYIVDSNVVTIVSTQTGNIASLGNLTDPVTTFSSLKAVASNALGTQVYVIDGNQVFMINLAESKGKLTSIGTSAYPAFSQLNDIAVDPKGTVFVSSFDQGVFRIDGVTGVVTSAGDLAIPAVTYSHPLAVAVDPFGNLLTTEWVSPYDAGSVRLLNVTTGGVQTLGLSAATPFGQSLTGAAIDKMGAVYICDLGNNRIARIDVRTGVVTAFATAAVPAIINPFGVAATPEGSIFWVDGSSTPVRGEVLSPSPAPTSKPTTKPSGQPSRQPTSEPSRQPTGKPTGQPSRQPSAQPSAFPSAQPSGRPSSQPTGQPTSKPTQLGYSCSAGAFLSGPERCMGCPGGTFSKGGIIFGCEPCQKGTYSGAWASACLPCAAGTAAGMGQGACIYCPSGTYSGDTAAECRACPTGTFSAPGSSTCTACSS